MKKLLTLFLVCCIAIEFCDTNEAKAATTSYYSSGEYVDANIDKSKYTSPGCLKKQEFKAYITDDARTKHVVGVVYVTNLFTTQYEKYKNTNVLDQWLTKITVQPKSITAKYTSTFGKSKVTQDFTLTEISQKSEMPSNIKLGPYAATSDAVQVVKTLINSWSIKANTGVSYKGIKIGVGGSYGESESEDVNLCTIYNSSRTSKFETKFTLLDPWYNNLTKINFRNLIM